VSGAAPLWRINPRIRLTWRDWGHDSVAFESLACTVHQFDPLAALVVSWFEQGPQDAASLCDRLAADAQGPAPTDFAEAVERTVGLLDRLGWIQRLAP